MSTSRFRPGDASKPRQSDLSLNRAGPANCRDHQPQKLPRSSAPNKKGGHFWPPLSAFSCGSGLGSLDVLCLPALGAFDYVELHLLSFLEAAETAGLDGGEMHEDILAILAADKTVALGVVKPLHCSCFHDVALFLFL